MIKTTEIVKWLESSSTEHPEVNYRHQSLTEVIINRKTGIEQLREITYQIHEEVLNDWREAFDISLDPLGTNTQFDLSSIYPSKLDLNTLKGYLGETLCAIVAENYKPFNINTWKVFAFFFKFHDDAFYALEKYRQTGVEPVAVIGRKGNDCIAFQVENDEIKSYLIGEAKCTADHNSQLIKDAHEQISNSVIVEIKHILEVLKEKNDDDSKKAIESLRKIYPSIKNYKRFNLICYVCGKKPVQKTSWISTEKPEKEYTSKDPLEAVEVYLSDMEMIINSIYK